MILFSWKWKVTLFEFVTDRWCNFCFCLRQIKLKILWPKLRWNLFFSPFRSWFESNKNSRKVFEVLCYLTLAWIQTRGVWQNSLLFWSPCGWAISNLSSTLLAFFLVCFSPGLFWLRWGVLGHSDLLGECCDHWGLCTVWNNVYVGGMCQKATFTWETLPWSLQLNVAK